MIACITCAVIQGEVNMYTTRLTAIDAPKFDNLHEIFTGKLTIFFLTHLGGSTVFYFLLIRVVFGSAIPLPVLHLDVL